MQCSCITQIVDKQDLICYHFIFYCLWFHVFMVGLLCTDLITTYTFIWQVYFVKFEFKLCFALSFELFD
jgi:hypothetical protein